MQDWEAGLTHPTAERLQGLIRALLATGGLTPGRESSHARELWTAVERETPRMHGAFDDEWFAGLIGTRHDGRGAERAQDWGEAPDTAAFVGRAAELELLQTWLLDERCRLVAVLGMGGIGKTSLAACAAQNIAPSFERVYWRSLRNAPPVAEWLAGAAGGRIRADHGAAAAAAWAALPPGARQLRDPVRAGPTREAIGDTSHQSCLLLTSREAPRRDGSALERGEWPLWARRGAIAITSAWTSRA